MKITLEDDPPMLLVAVAHALADRRRMRKAEEYCRAALALNPDLHEARIEWGTHQPPDGTLAGSLEAPLATGQGNYEAAERNDGTCLGGAGPGRAIYPSLGRAGNGRPDPVHPLCSLACQGRSEDHPGLRTLQGFRFAAEDSRNRSHSVEIPASSAHRLAWLPPWMCPAFGATTWVRSRLRARTFRQCAVRDPCSARRGSSGSASSGQET